MDRSARQRGKADRTAGADRAAALAVAALTYLAAEPERLSRFLALTGLDPASIRTAAGAPGFLAGVLEYLAGEETLLVAFAAEAEVAPGEIERARFALSGASWEREMP